MLPGRGVARRRRTVDEARATHHGLAVLPDRADLVVVGAGIVGLAHAYEAHRPRPVGGGHRPRRPSGRCVGPQLRSLRRDRPGGRGPPPGAGDPRAMARARLAGRLLGLRRRHRRRAPAADDEMAVLRELADVRRDEVVPARRRRGPPASRGGRRPALRRGAPPGRRARRPPRGGAGPRRLARRPARRRGSWTTSLLGIETRPSTPPAARSSPTGSSCASVTTSTGSSPTSPTRVACGAARSTCSGSRRPTLAASTPPCSPAPRCCATAPSPTCRRSARCGEARGRVPRAAGRRRQPDVHPAPGRRPADRRHPPSRRHPRRLPGRGPRRAAPGEATAVSSGPTG